jgi:hypothetical protein
VLKHEDVSKLEGLGWIEYMSDFLPPSHQFSIEVDSIDMVYFLFAYYSD